MKYFFAFLIIIFLAIAIYPYSSSIQATAVREQDSNQSRFSGVNSDKIRGARSVGQGVKSLPKAPSALEEAKTTGKKFLAGLPGIFKKSWQEGLSIWNKIFKWFKDIWNSYVAPRTQKLWNKIKSFLGTGIEKKKPEIKKEFQKEKQEMKEDIPRVGKSIWQRFMELIK